MNVNVLNSHISSHCFSILLAELVRSMATSSVVSIEAVFELEITKVRNEIQSHFGELVKSVRTIEAELLKEVDKILPKFKEKVKEKDKMISKYLV